MKIKQRIFEIIQIASPNDKVSKIFDISLIALILLNVSLVIADTFSLPLIVQKISGILEKISVIIFSIEYLLRIWTADLLFPKKKLFYS